MYVAIIGKLTQKASIVMTCVSEHTTLATTRQQLSSSALADHDALRQQLPLQQQQQQQFSDTRGETVRSHGCAVIGDSSQFITYY